MFLHLSTAGNPRAEENFTIYYSHFKRISVGTNAQCTTVEFYAQYSYTTMHNTNTVHLYCVRFLFTLGTAHAPQNVHIFSQETN